MLTDTILIDQLQVVAAGCAAGAHSSGLSAQMGELQLHPAAVDTRQLMSHVLRDCFDIVRSTQIQARALLWLWLMKAANGVSVSVSVAVCAG